MAGTLRSRKRNDIENTEKSSDSESIAGLDLETPSSEIDVYAHEVLESLIIDNLPPTPNNFSLYFDRLLDAKSEAVRKQVVSALELEDSNENENTQILEQSLKKGFSSVKNILTSTASLYKNMTLMTKILEKRKKELGKSLDSEIANKIVQTLEADIGKLNNILKTQSSQMKTLYDETAVIVKSVDKETIFDNKFGVYNKRYLLSKIEQEIELIKKFDYMSSLIMIELSNDLKKSIRNEKAIMLMTKTLARLILKTSRRSAIVAHYAHGVFLMLLKHTDIESAKKASERLCYLVENSSFFFSDKEIQLKISIGITNISSIHSAEEIVVSAMEGMEKAYEDSDKNYAVSLRN